MEKASEKMDVTDSMRIICKAEQLPQSVKINSEKSREYLMSILENDFLGSKSIDSVKSSDAKEWVVRMYKKGYSYRQSITSNVPLKRHCILL